MEFEHSTEIVLDWLNYLETPFLRINGQKILMNEEFSIEIDYSPDSSSEKIIIGDIILNPTEISIVWFRRWSSHDKHSFFVLNDNPSIFAKINDNISLEFRGVSYAFFNSFKNCKWLSHPSENLNKIDVLKGAQKFGLKIPASLITSSKETLQVFKKKHELLVTKCITDYHMLSDKNLIFTLYTNEVSQFDIDKLPCAFFPTLFQEKIDKKYEIRSFYLAGSFYSMAIFSQRNIKTDIDFRRYDKKVPNRTVPYNLPVEIEEKITNLMKELNFETGSVDLIRNHNGDYIFLEINPIGQFGMTSYPCNYKIEKKLACYLKNINYATKHTKHVESYY